MIIKCPKCGTHQKIPDDPKQSTRYHCANCRFILAERKEPATRYMNDAVLAEQSKGTINKFTAILGNKNCPQCGARVSWHRLLMGGGFMRYRKRWPCANCGAAIGIDKKREFRKLIIGIAVMAAGFELGEALLPIPLYQSAFLIIVLTIIVLSAFTSVELRAISTSNAAVPGASSSLGSCSSRPSYMEHMAFNIRALVEIFIGSCIRFILLSSAAAGGYIVAHQLATEGKSQLWEVGLL